MSSLAKEVGFGAITSSSTILYGAHDGSRSLFGMSNDVRSWPEAGLSITSTKTLVVPPPIPRAPGLS